MAYKLRQLGAQVQADLDKIEGVEDGAQVNVQSDWNENDPTSDAYIKNKPTIPSTLNEIASVTATESQASGGNNVITITETNGAETSFNVKNGTDGVGFASVAVHSPVDGGMDITLTNGDVMTIDLQHNHDGLIATGEINRIKFHVCEDETEYTGITTKDANTLYLIPESAS